jgi:hypothetical protein
VSPLAAPFASGVLEVADEFLLLGIDRDCPLTRRKRFFGEERMNVELSAAECSS